MHLLTSILAWCVGEVSQVFFRRRVFLPSSLRILLCPSMAEPKVVKLTVTDLTPENFAPYGQVITPSKDGKPFGCDDAKLELSKGIPRHVGWREPILFWSSCPLYMEWTIISIVIVWLYAWSWWELALDGFQLGFGSHVVISACNVIFAGIIVLVLWREAFWVVFLIRG